MVAIWLMMVNNNLVGGAMCPSWKMMEFVNEKDHIPYMLRKPKNVPNHQSVDYWRVASMVIICGAAGHMSHWNYVWQCVAT